MCRTINTREMCPTCGNIKRIAYAEIRCESSIHPIRDPPYDLTICRSYREFRNTIVADSNCKNCNTKEMDSFLRDSSSSSGSGSDLSGGDKLQGLRRDTTAESMKLSDATEDISEDDHDPKDDKDSAIWKLLELETEMDLIIEILDLEIDQEYILIKRDNLKKLMDAAAAESTKSSDHLTDGISEDDCDPNDDNDSDISVVSVFSDESHEEMMLDLLEGRVEYDDEIFGFDSNDADFLLDSYLCSAPEPNTRVRQLKREAMGLKWCQ